MRVFLSGPMGSGKSTLCGAVAAQLGECALDLDAMIERRAGCTVAQIFEQQGEAVFRELERDVIRELLDTDGNEVIALGGGTVTQAGLRRQLLSEGLLITLMASPQTLARRVGTGFGRPLLASDASEERMRELLAKRGQAYAECHATFQTDLQSQAEIAKAIGGLHERAPLLVPLGRRSYRVEVGSGIRSELSKRISGASSVLVVTDETVGPLWAEGVAAGIRSSGLSVRTVVLPPGEPSKHIGSVQKIWEAGLDFEMDRRSWVIGVGGGVVGDMAGFAASSLLRGISVGHVPTTLLSMVDSAVGGKTGFDTKHGKNLIGAFHQPGFVLADTDTLSTLPQEEFVAGLAEVVKSAWIDSEAAVAQLERDASQILDREPAALRRAINMSCKLKARIVTQDERESGVRALLNLGHTVGHAIEADQGFGHIRHGEAVSLGMVAACRLAQRREAQSVAQGDRLVALLREFGLPVDVDSHLRPEVWQFLKSDKKRAGDSIGFVVPSGPGDVEVVSMPVSEVEGAVVQCV